MTRQGTRFYTRETVGPKCPICGLLVPVALIEAGITVHPMCEWEQEQERER